MLTVNVAALALVSFLPRVEDPWPDTIGLDLPFAVAGAGGILASAFYASGSKAERDEAIRNGGLCGFWLGVLFMASRFSVR
jgi:hypothetical protein